ncbi:hypothetical protein BROSI_A2326 [Candidatus Brocadia sinica JPN1]|uniref:Uncharacterized protein n=1 Tax=Candidatus Brocadia sinica JPN1 TaxID=1197129 RepID=A0ABQ0JYH7_9BACT|nr:hypothetical protein BROSI_A2326 [Candidatus Brocadia sinica JPN1]
MQSSPFFFNIASEMKKVISYHQRQVVDLSWRGK